MSICSSVSLGNNSKWPLEGKTCMPAGSILAAIIQNPEEHLRLVCLCVCHMVPSRAFRYLPVIFDKSTPREVRALAQSILVFRHSSLLRRTFAVIVGLHLHPVLHNPHPPDNKRAWPKQSKLGQQAGCHKRRSSNGAQLVLWCFCHLFRQFFLPVFWLELLLPDPFRCRVKEAFAKMRRNDLTSSFCWTKFPENDTKFETAEIFALKLGPKFQVLSLQVQKSHPPISPDISHQRFQVSNQISPKNFTMPFCTHGSPNNDRCSPHIHLQSARTSLNSWGCPHSSVLPRSLWSASAVTNHLGCKSKGKWV